MAVMLALVALSAACQPGFVNPVVGSGPPGSTGDGGGALDATLTTPTKLAVAPDGDVAVVDASTCAIRRISGGTISTVAGDGTCGYSGDGGPAVDAQIQPQPESISHGSGIAFDAAANLFLADVGNGVIREITPDGTISTLVSTDGLNGGFFADIAVAADGNLYAAVPGLGPDTGIYRVDSDGTATRIATFYPVAIAADPTGGLVAYGNGRIVHVDLASGAVDPIADALGLVSIAVDRFGNVYGATDTQVFRYDEAGPVLIAGTGAPDSSVEPFYGDAHDATLSPRGIVATPNNGLLVTSGHVVYRIDHPSTVVAPLPGAPTNVTATAAAGEATVGWTAATNTAAYATATSTVTAQPGGASCTTDEVSCTVTGLTNGTSYTFTVHTTTGAGQGPESEPSAPVVPLSVPDAPTITRVDTFYDEAVVWWSLPADQGGTPVYSGTATADPGGLSCTTTTAHTCTIVGLTVGTTYTFSVTVANSVGSSPPSEPSLPITQLRPPGRPTGVAAVPGDAQTTVSWTPPSDTGGGPILGYLVTASPGGATCTTDGATACTVTGLTNGTTYGFTVAARNALGYGPATYTAVSATPARLPGAPTGLQVEVTAPSTVEVTWTAPDDTGGVPLTHYVVSSDVSGLACTTAETSCVVDDVAANIPTTFTVAAANPTGTGPSTPPSDPVTVVGPPPVAIAHTWVTGADQVTVDTSWLTVGWDAIANDGGSPIVAYTVIATSDIAGDPPIVCHPDANPIQFSQRFCVVEGLQVGHAYTFTVIATNQYGDSPPSAPTSPVIAPPFVPGCDDGYCGGGGNEV